jgi:cytochrome P450
MTFVLGGRSPTFDDLPQLRCADAILAETLRPYPAAYAIGRQAAEPCVIGGYNVPRGMTLFMSQRVLHRDPRFFDDPEAFRPERWMDGLAKRLPRYAYFPFGGGPRVCIGTSFAQMAATLVLATVPGFGSPGPGGAAVSVDDSTARRRVGSPPFRSGRR